VTYLGSIGRTAGLSAVIALSTLPAAAYAGKHTLAVAAIAQAKGKIEAGDKVGAGRQAPELQAQARASLSNAQDLLSRGHKGEAILAARHASEYADQAIVTADNSRAASERDRRDDAQDSAAAAMQSANDANARASLAQQATVDANMSANDANRRALLAQQATADANARADAIRNAPPVAAAPSTTTTTVAVVEAHTAGTAIVPVRHTARKTTRHRTRSGLVRKSTTTVTTTRS